MQVARIELLQRMPVFGGIGPTSSGSCSTCARWCPSRRTSSFSVNTTRPISMFVLEAGKVAVLKSWRGQEFLLRI